MMNVVNPVQSAGFIGRSGGARYRRGFTLVELLVAIGLLMLLAVGINQILTSIHKLVSIGTAVADISAAARIAEAQLRDDIAGFNRMFAKDTCMVIRGREIGDNNGNGQLDSGETAMYLTEADRLTDLENQIEPYAEGSLAVTVRLDELMFFAEAPATSGYQTYQTFDQIESLTPIITQEARIYYGHGLRPAPDPNFVPDPNDPCRIPVRQLDPDGDFGQAAGEDNRFVASGFNSQVSELERNRYAGEFFIVRHQLLMAGGEVILPPSPGGPGYPLADDRQYVPYVRELESSVRFETSHSIGDPPLGGARPASQLDPRLIADGRVDICAQDTASARRWLEGVKYSPPATPLYVPPDASAYNSGPFEETPYPIVPNNAVKDSPLWIRAHITKPGVNDSIDVQLQNTIYIRSAIAGMMTRILAESEAPVFQRCASLSVNDPDPADAFMDLSATFLRNCSSFEVAWSDGTVWDQLEPLEAEDPCGNPVATYQKGDIVWFDYDYSYDQYLIDHPFLDQVVDRLTPPSEIPRGRQNVELITFPDALLPEYLRDVTGGALPIVPGDACADHEYLAVFPFRAPSPSIEGDYYKWAWPKPKLLRIRMTLHDPQFNIKGGKPIEFIFSIDPN